MITLFEDYDIATRRIYDELIKGKEVDKEQEDRDLRGRTPVCEVQ